MKFRNILPLMFLAAGSFLPKPASAQDFNIMGMSPKAEIEFVDGNEKLNSMFDISLDANKTEGDLELSLSREKIEHKFGLNFLMNKDPVWSTINGGLKYGFKWEPTPFIKQELNTFTGYQHVSNIKAPFLYYAGQFFTGGEESLSFVLGNKDKARLEATGTLGGYVCLLDKKLMWDNYKMGYKTSGILPLSFFNFNAWFNQFYEQFNKDKYFFVDSSNNINFGGSLELNLEELALNAFFKKEYVFGKEVGEEGIYAGITSLFKEAGVGLRFNIELNQLDLEFFYFGFGVGKTLLEDKAYAEIAFNFFNNNPSLEFRLKVSPGNQEANKIIIKKPFRKISPLIGQQGYKKPSENFDEAIDNTDTLAKIGNVGNYFPYAKGLFPVRTPQKFFEDGYGDCDEIAWYRTYAARQNGYKDSWFIGYYDLNQGRGHAFFLVKDKDGRAYVTDNDHGAWLRVNIKNGASKEEMTKAAVEQLSRYMALGLPEGQDYSFEIFDEKYNTLYSEDVSNFHSKAPESAPIDMGLMSRVGSSTFY